jgi:carbon starvation protein
MNSVLLLIIAAAILVFGYRFYAKFLAATMFLPAANYSTTTPPSTPHAPNTAGRYLHIGQYVAAIGTLGAWVGTAAAASLGWTPAFLWIVAGSVLIGGLLGFGALWWVRERPLSLPTFPARIRLPLLGLVLGVVLLTNAIFALLVVGLLDRYPGAVAAFWVQIPIALGLGVFLHQRERFELVPATLIALALSLTLVWLGGKLPVAFTGALGVEVGTARGQLDGTTLWLALVFAYLYYSDRLAPALPRAQGYLTTVQLGLLLTVALVGAAVLHPDIAAPNFDTHTSMPVPLIFALLGVGATGGIYMIAAARSVPAPDVAGLARPLGYGAALLDAATAIVILLACTAAFSTTEEWRQAYASAGSDLFQGIGIALRGLALFGQTLGLDPEFIQHFAAIVGLGLAVAGLRAGLSLQSRLQQLHSESTGQPRPMRASWWLPLLLALGVHLSGGISAVGAWALLGGFNLLLTAIALLVLGLALLRLRRPASPALAAGAALLIVANWAVVDRLWDWAERGQWIGVCIVAAGILLELWVLAAAAHEWGKAWRVARTT